jgi:hypothetical protein
MSRDYDAVTQFQNDLARNEGRFDHGRALEIFTRLWEEGCALGVLPPADPMEGIETDLTIARILNSCSKS